MTGARGDDVEVGALARRVGYVLKQAQSLLRARMEEGLRPLELTVPQYACLELLRQNPGLTNAELARAGFVTAQSMNGVVKGLQGRGCITRPETAPSGRSRPFSLTAAGLALVEEADATVREVERRLLAELTSAEGEQLLASLQQVVSSLDGAAPDDATS